MVKTSFMDEYHHLIFQCIFRNWYRISILYRYFWQHLKNGRTFYLQYKITNLLHRWSSIRRFMSIIFFCADIPKESIICGWSLYHGIIIFPRSIFHLNQISRFGLGKYCYIHNSFLMHTRIRILDLRIRNYLKWFNDGSMPLRTNALPYFTKYDYLADYLKWNGSKWTIHDAWFHSNHRYNHFGHYGLGDLASLAITEKISLLAHWRSGQKQWVRTKKEG